ncbi:MAG: hypothetical protein WCO78_04895 [Candidatus Roizmanbacteria bacterium]
MKINKKLITIVQILIVAYILYYFKSGNISIFNGSKTPSPTPVPPRATIAPTATRQPTSPPSLPTQMVKAIPSTISDSDPVVDCKIGLSCATMKIKKSTCATYQVCCTLGNDHIPMKTMDECYSALSDYQKQIIPTTQKSVIDSSTYVFPTYVFPTWKPFPTFAPLPTFGPFPTFEPLPTFKFTSP